MSRTIRRKNFVPKWVTHTHLKVELDEPYGYRSCKYSEDGRWTKTYVWVEHPTIKAYYYVDVPKVGKDLAKSLSKHHGDHGYTTGCGGGSGPGKWFRQNEQQSYRANAKQELHEYLRNEEYEVMILANPKLPYWD